MAVRVPATIDAVVDQNPDYGEPTVRSIRELAADLRRGAPFPPLAVPELDAGFARGLAERTGEGWLDTDWFFAETYAYRQLAERSGYFRTGRDPFAPTKVEEYRSRAHADAFAQAVAVADSERADLASLLLVSLFGNRIDLSFAASRAHGLVVSPSDLLADDRERAVPLVERGSGPVHVIADNAGTELTLDLVLVDFLLRKLDLDVTLHVKVHPTFVSDATAADVRGFLTAGEPGIKRSPACAACVARLAACLESGRLAVREHPFWNGPDSLWDLPADLAQAFSGARLVLLKGDANYRRAVGDALWPSTTPFAEATAAFPAPLLALRTLKSDPILGLREGDTAALDNADADWRFNGKRGVASLGGTL